MNNQNDDNNDAKVTDAADELFDLHAALRKCFLKRLASGEPVSAAESEVMRKFLFDSGVKVPTGQWQVPPVPAYPNLPFGPNDQPDYSEADAEPVAKDSVPERTVAALPAGLKLPFSADDQPGSVEPTPAAPVTSGLGDMQRQLVELQRQLGEMERRDGPKKSDG